MAELKTKQTSASVEKFLKSVKDDTQREDSLALVEMMKQATKAEPKMWGPSIIGFGNYRCVYASGREVDWFPIGFSPRKQNISVYLMCSFDGYGDLLKKLGKHKTGKSCLYIKRLSDIDQKVLKQMIAASVKASKKQDHSAAPTKKRSKKKAATKKTAKKKVTRESSKKSARK